MTFKNWPRIGLVLVTLAAFATGASAAPTVVSTGTEEDVPGADGRLPHIATDSLNQPHIVMDVDRYPTVYFYDRIGGSWQVSSYNAGGSQFYNPHIEINNFGRAWISGVKWYPDGMGVVLRGNVTSSPVFLGYTRTRAAAVRRRCRCRISPSIPPSTTRALSMVATAATGSACSGVGRDLFGGFRFAGDRRRRREELLLGVQGRDLSALGRLSEVRLALVQRLELQQLRAQRGGQRRGDLGPAPAAILGWATTAAIRWCSPTTLNPRPLPIHGLHAVRRVRASVCRSGVPPTAAATEASRSVQRRPARGGSGGCRWLAALEPQGYPAKNGGVWLAWQSGGNVRICYAPASVTSFNNLGPWIQFPGSRPAICVDGNGDLHVAYLNGGLKYRKIDILNVTSSLTQSGDFDGDGIDDLGLFDSETGKWYIQTRGGKVLANGINWGWSGALAAPGDYDGDGKSELGIFDPATGNWYVRKLGGKVLLKGHNWGSSDSLPVPGDYDGDGADDLAVYSASAGNWYVWSFKRKRILGLDQSGGFSGAKVVPGDFNGDGKSDLAIFDSGTSKWYIRTLQLFLAYADRGVGPARPRSKATSTETAKLTLGSTTVRPGTGSFGRLRRTEPSSGRKTGGFPARRLCPPTTTATARRTSPSSTRRPATGTSSRAAVAEAVIRNWGWSTTKPVPMDYDGDTKADLAVFDNASGAWYVAKSSGGTMIRNWGWPGAVPVPGDYDKDKKADLTVFDSTTGNWYMLLSKTGKAVTRNWGWSGASARSADFDNDGADDMAVYHTGTGRWYIWSHAKKAVLENGNQSGLRRRQSDPRRLRWRRSCRSRRVRYGLRQVVHQAARPDPRLGSEFGWSTAIPVSGDFNNDRADDLNLYDPTTGNWYSRTAEGKVLTWAFGWGYQGAIPVSGKYDRDEISEIAVWDQDDRGLAHLLDRRRPRDRALPEMGIPRGNASRLLQVVGAGASSSPA